VCVKLNNIRDPSVIQMLFYSLALLHIYFFLGGGGAKENFEGTGLVPQPNIFSWHQAWY